jgi:hypothetical protein
MAEAKIREGTQNRIFEVNVLLLDRANFLRTARKRGMS